MVFTRFQVGHAWTTWCLAGAMVTLSAWMWGSPPAWGNDNGPSGPYYDPAALQAGPGVTYLGRSKEPIIPSSVFVDRTADDSGMPRVASRYISVPNVPIADPYAAGLAPPGGTLPQSGLNGHTKPLDVTGIDPFGFILHSTYLAYGSNSVKGVGEQTGIYGYATTTVNTLEVAFDDTRIRFRNGFQFNQQDITVVLSDYAIENIRLRGGFHYINNNDKSTNQGIVGMGGIQYFIPKVWEIGVDAYASSYRNYNPSLTVTQLMPHLGVYLWPGLKAEARGYAIHASRDLGLSSSNFYSLEGRLTREFDKWTVGGYGWGGEQTFAVRQEGFVVFNLNEKHTSGFGGEVAHKFSPHTKLTGRMGCELFTDFTLQRGTNLTYITLLLTHSF